jgi:hypothetical protein
MRLVFILEGYYQFAIEGALILVHVGYGM